jgi:hypothetical protein
MKQESKLSQKQEPLAEQQTQAQTAREFASTEELLRADAAKTTVPPEIEERLKKSAGQLQPPPPRPWWKHLLGR